jgi:Tol biopolymer transport system component
VSEEYTFSEPQVVLTGIADIIEWLPNNQQVLLTRRLDKLSGHQEIILLNPQSNEIQIYAERESVNEQPVWVDGANAVAYLVRNILNKTSDGKYVSPADIQLQLWLSRGDPNQAELIEEKEIISDQLPYLSIASKPGSGQIIYRANIDQEFSQRDLSHIPFNVLQSLPFDFSRWEYRKEFRPLSIYDMTWRPNSSQVFLYANGDIGGYTFLLDTNTGKVCELNLGAKENENGWALNAQWSSNGRYLAVARTWGMRPIKTSDLSVTDMVTGELYAMNLTPPDIDGQHFVIDIAWAPDNLHLVAVAQVREQNPSSSDHDYRKLGNLYLVDFHTNQAVQIPSSDIKVGSGPGSINLAWSDDGKSLLAKCPTAQEERLCLFSVKK